MDEGHNDLTLIIFLIKIVHLASCYPTRERNVDENNKSFAIRVGLFIVK